jgi:hypothetical protein
MAKIKASHIQCGFCGSRFRSPIFWGDTETFEFATTWCNKVRCPECGHMIKCDKGNMSYVLERDAGGFQEPKIPDDRTR